MRVLIVEDETVAYENLAQMIRNCDPDIEIVANTEGVEQTVRWLQSNERPDLIFMDIHLSDGSAFNIFELMEVEVPIIFTTAYDQYAIDAFKVNSVDYLLKPVEASALKRAVARCRMSGGGVDVEALLKAIGNTGSQQKEYKERYIVRFNDRIVPLEIKNIAYIYSEEKNNYLMTFDGHQYVLDSSLDLVMDELNPELFFRISRSCIIAMTAITSIIKQAGGRLRIVSTPESDMEMTVSRSRVDDFLKWIEK